MTLVGSGRKGNENGSDGGEEETDNLKTFEYHGGVICGTHTRTNSGCMPDNTSEQQQQNIDWKDRD